MNPPLRHLAAACACLAAAPALAVGFGGSSTRTTLGQHLDFVAPVMAEPGESLRRECVSAQVYAGDARVGAQNVRVVLEGPADGSQRVRVTTTVPMVEPVVTVEVSVGCGSQVSRRFVSFIDPPSVRLAEAEPEPSAEPVRPPVLRSASVSPDEGRPDQPRRSSERAGPSRGTRVAAATRSRGRGADATTPAGTTPSTRMARRASAPGRSALASAATAPGTGPRLRLDAAPLPRTALAASAPKADTAAAQAALAAATAAAPHASSPTDPTVAETAAKTALAQQAEHERMQSLEAAIARLRSEGAATQKSLATLQAQLRQAESDRYGGAVVYALGAAAALFALLSFVLWRGRPKARSTTRWFDVRASRLPKAAEAGATATPVAAATAVPDVSQPTPSQAAQASSWHAHSDNLPLQTRPATIGGLEVTTVLAPSASRDAFPAIVDAPAQGRAESQPSMEQLIDLEQQAEFFMVLGQDEAAAALLEHYVDSDGQSPLPYLQLLELQHRRGDATAHQLVRDAYTTRFGSAAPEWASHGKAGNALDAHPQVTARLQALWPTPLSAMQALEAILLRRHAVEEAFDLPAYSDLLFLYSVARELAGQVETDFGAIDLFLPLEAAAGELEPPSAGNEIDFDVSSWHDTDIAKVTPIRRAG